MKMNREAGARKKGSSGAPSLFILRGSLFIFILSAVGCTWDQFHLFTPPPPPPPPVASVVLRGDQLEPEHSPAEGTAEANLAGARELFRQGEYSKAGRMFRYVADDTHNPVAMAEEARYYEAECLRLQGHLPQASDKYIKMLNDFPSGAYREQGVQQLFEIANHWLDDTRQEMVESREVREGKRWFVTPHFVHFDRESPILDKEGRALAVLEQVRYNDMTGPLGDKSLFLLGSVKFFNEDYREADMLFTQLVEMHPNSSFAEQAAKLSIISKYMSTGGPEYDGRKVAEARQMVDTVQRNYPELATKESDFLARQRQGITLQQAAKDYDAARFWERRGHPGSAWFCYEVVCRRYPETKYAEMAAQRMAAIRANVEKERQSGDGSWLGKVLTIPNLFGSEPTRPRPEGTPTLEQAPAPRPVPLEQAPSPNKLPLEQAPPPNKLPLEQAPPPNPLPPSVIRN
jgi:outer membrane protein assembly factor BamD (BamD/ComL family)